MDEARGYATGRARRQQILSEAALAFGRSGFDGVTLQEIADACGISRPGLLHHFRSKEELLIAILEQRDANDQEQFRQELERSGSPFDAVVALVRANESAPAITAMFTQLAFEAIRPDHPAHEFFESVYARIHEDLRSAIAEMQQRGDLTSSANADQLASALLALRDGLTLQALLQHRDGKVERKIEVLEAMLALIRAGQPEASDRRE